MACLETVEIKWLRGSGLSAEYLETRKVVGDDGLMIIHVSKPSWGSGIRKPGSLSYVSTIGGMSEYTHPRLGRYRAYSELPKNVD